MTMNKTPRRNPSVITAVESEDVLRALLEAPALFESEAALDALESDIGAARDGVTRRAALQTLAMSGAELVDNVVRDREFACACAEVHRCVDEYLGRLQSLVETLKIAQMRVMVALTHRPDVREVLAEGGSTLPPVDAAD
jgi:hypothetical protein